MESLHGAVQLRQKPDFRLVVLTCYSLFHSLLLCSYYHKLYRMKCKSFVLQVKNQIGVDFLHSATRCQAWHLNANTLSRAACWLTATRTTGVFFWMLKGIRNLKGHPKEKTNKHFLQLYLTMQIVWVWLLLVQIIKCISEISRKSFLPDAGICPHSAPTAVVGFNTVFG